MISASSKSSSSNSAAVEGVIEGWSDENVLAELFEPARAAGSGRDKWWFDVVDERGKVGECGEMGEDARRRVNAGVSVQLW